MMKAYGKKSIALMLICLMILSIVQLPTFAAEDTYGILLKDIGLITGDNGNLMELKNISRVEMIAILSKLYPEEFEAYTAPDVATFTDVPVSHWGYKYVEFAFEKGITAGKSKTFFGAKDPVNYNQASIFLIRVLGFDIGDIQYTTTASEIKATYELGMTVPTDGAKSLLRREVFELIVKALAMDDVIGISGIDMFLRDEALKATFMDRANVLINTPVVNSLGGGFYNIYYANGDVYTGGFDGNAPYGNGMLKFDDGNLYIGQFSGGQFSGYGIFVWTNGDFYEGFWQESMYGGLGLYTYEDGSYQYGVWMEDTLTEELDSLTPEQIETNALTPLTSSKINFVDTLGKPMVGVLVSITDETNAVVYTRITDVDGAITLPLTGDYTLFSLALAQNSAFRFNISGDRYMVTIFGKYEPEVTFELIK